MKKISDDSSLLGLNVKLADGVDFTESEGEIIKCFSSLVIHLSR